jgi:hypothetical protein
LLAGCKAKDGELNKTVTADGTEGQSQPTPFYGSNIPFTNIPGTPGSNSAVTNSSDPSTGWGQPRKIILLPSIFNGSQAGTNVNPYSTNSENLPPEKWREWPVIPKISEHALEIYRAGIAQGNDPTHFSKVGDCQNIRQYFLGVFDTPETYTLGENYAYLQETIDYFSTRKAITGWAKIMLTCKRRLTTMRATGTARANPSALASTWLPCWRRCMLILKSANRESPRWHAKSGSGNRPL